MMARKSTSLRTACVVLLTLTLTGLMSCSASKTAYLNNYDMYANLPHPELYEIKIKPFDILFITAFSEGNPVVSSFNILEAATYAERNSLLSGSRPIEYMVGEDGMLNLPLVGRMMAAGKSVSTLEKEIGEMLLEEQFRERPVVTVRLKYFTFSVVGEVNSPGMYYVDFDRMNIFEALARAGDLTIHGCRDNVKVIREYSDGTKEIGIVDLNDADVLNSPFFHIRQDDVVYVEPNRAKVRNADVAMSSSLWIRGFSIGLSLLALVFSIIR